MSQADYCPCPNWGYALKGRPRVGTNGREKVLQAGDAYSRVPGHTAVADGDSEFLEVAPSGLHRQAMDAARWNVGVS